MSVLEVTKEENVYITTMNDPMTENGLTPEVIQEHFAILDEIEASSENVAVVLSSGDPKSWCTGINLEKVSRDQLPSFKSLMDRLILRCTPCQCSYDRMPHRTYFCWWCDYGIGVRFLNHARRSWLVLFS